MSIAFLFCAIFFPSRAHAAAPTIVQKSPNTCFTSSATNTITCSFSSNVTAGNMILVWVMADRSDTIATSTMTGETFTKVTGASNAGSGSSGQEALYATNSAAGGQKSVTATLSSGTADIHVHMMEVSGQTASPQDATGNTLSTTCSVSTSASTTNANDLVIAFFGDEANNRTLSATSPYTQVQQTNDSTGGDAALSESNTVSSTGVQTAACTGNSGDTLAQGIIAIAGASGGASCTPTLTLLGVGRC